MRTGMQQFVLGLLALPTRADQSIARGQVEQGALPLQRVDYLPCALGLLAPLAGAHDGRCV